MVESSRWVLKAGPVSEAGWKEMKHALLCCVVLGRFIASISLVAGGWSHGLFAATLW